MFTIRILNPKRVIFEGKANGVFLQGDQSEFEILDYHAPLISLLREGDIVVDNKTYIPIKSGVVKFANNECIVLAEV